MLDWKRALRYTELQYILIPIFFSLCFSLKAISGKKWGGGNTTENKGTKLLSLNKAYDLSAVVIGGLDFLKQFM